MYFSDLEAELIRNGADIRMFGEGLNHMDSSLIDMANRLYLSVNFLQLDDWENAYNNNSNMLKALAILRNQFTRNVTSKYA